MGKNNLAGRITTDRAEVRIVERRLNRLVERGVKMGLCGVGFVLSGREGREGGSVPRHSKAVNVKQAVPGCDFSLGGGFCMDGGVVGEEFGKVVLVDLLAESVGRSCTSIRMQAFA
jgi:hypothetical protein